MARPETNPLNQSRGAEHSEIIGFGFINGGKNGTAEKTPSLVIFASLPWTFGLPWGPMKENHLRAALQERRFFCSVELVLGRDHTVTEAEAFIRDAAGQNDGLNIVSLTDLPGGNPALPPEAFLSAILECGLTPIAHLTGKDGNRSQSESRLHHFARLGVENVLALTGDAQKDGFLGRAKPVYDLDSVLLLLLIEAMREGMEYKIGPRTVRTTPFAFLPGAVVNPYKTRAPDLMMQLYKLQLKAALGAKYIITQLGFNVRKLHELKLYMEREGLGGIPLIADVYVPTATIAKMMKSGELAGCIAPDSLIRRLEGEKKPQRLERAALMVAAARGLGCAGAHLGGFGLTYRDFVTIVRRSEEIGEEWRKRLDELNYETPGEFYLLPASAEGLSESGGDYQLAQEPPAPPWKLKLSSAFHRLVIHPDSVASRFLSARLDKPHNGNVTAWKKSFWYRLLNLSKLYRIPVLGCAGCGDCVQDHLNYSGCTMRWCYKNLRNGPCGGSRPDGQCEADAQLPCIWNIVYRNTRAAGDDPRKFSRTVIPPRDWVLDRTNALANRFAGLDNVGHRIHLEKSTEERRQEKPHPD
jgi:methylenetetrahydrofolate reductase (NADPH)